MSALATVLRSVTEWRYSAPQTLIDYVLGAIAFVALWLVLVLVLGIDDGTSF